MPFKSSTGSDLPDQLFKYKGKADGSGWKKPWNKRGEEGCMMRTFGYALWALSVVILAIGGISRLTFTPFFGVEARAFLGLAGILQLYVMSLLLLELVSRQEKR